MKNKQKILLTGASGTVGFEVLKELLQNKNKYEITVFDIQSKKATRLLSPFKNEINVQYGDISNFEDVKRVCENKDFVIHLAALIPPIADDKPELARRINTIGTENLTKNLERLSPNVFFQYSSSISVYGDRLNNPNIEILDKISASKGDEYGKTKIEAEKIIRNSTINWSIFRLSAVMGGHKISKLMFHQPLKTSLEIITPQDVARAFVFALEKKAELRGKTFNLGGGKNCRISYIDFLSRSFEIYGLGKVDFPPKSFAEKNFHCGFYNDGDDLENILQFRRDNLDNYFQKETLKTSIFKKRITSIFKKQIKKHLLKQSEPLIACQTNDKTMMEQFFN